MSSTQHGSDSAAADTTATTETSTPDTIGSDTSEGQERERSPEEIQADIARTRQELGETVEALTAKLDVKTRARARVETTRRQAADRAAVAQRRANDVVARGRDAVTDDRGQLLPAVPITAAAVAGLVVGVIVWRRTR